MLINVQQNTNASQCACYERWRQIANDVITHNPDITVIYLYTKSSFPKRVKRQSKNRGCNGEAMFRDHGLEKSSP